MPPSWRSWLFQWIPVVTFTRFALLPCLCWVGHEQSNTPKTFRINWNDFRDNKEHTVPNPPKTYKSHSRWSHELCDFSATHICSYWKLNRLLDFAASIRVVESEFKAHFSCTSMCRKGLWLIDSLSTILDLRHRRCLATTTIAGCFCAHLWFLEVTSCQLLTTGSLSSLRFQPC